MADVRRTLKAQDLGDDGDLRTHDMSPEFLGALVDLTESAPPQWSPDGNWWWTGSEWIARENAPAPMASTTTASASSMDVAVTPPEPVDRASSQGATLPSGPSAAPSEGMPWSKFLSQPLVLTSAVCFVVLLMVFRNSSSGPFAPALLFTGAIVALVAYVRHIARRDRRTSLPTRQGQALEKRYANSNSSNLRHGFFLGGTGTALQPGSHYLVGLEAQNVVVRSTQDLLVSQIPFETVLEARTWGRGAVTTGGGVIGGGFGVEGALEGMAIAGVLNALTQRKTVDCLVRIATADCEMTFGMQSADPREMDVLLAPLRVHMRSATSREVPLATTDPGDVVRRLQELTKLHAQHSLSDEEFANAKMRILSG